MEHSKELLELIVAAKEMLNVDEYTTLIDLDKRLSKSEVS